MKNNQAKYQQWVEKAVEDKEVSDELKTMNGDINLIEDAFYRDLEFGTGGLRGVIGAGTNRMNIYTVRKASQGLANYVCQKFSLKDRRIAVSFDSRIKSDLFAKTASEVFAANGIKVYIYSELMPTPCLSFAVRKLHCSAGIMVTASHNPAKYNGYKVYGSDGCQITTEAAEEILNEIEKVDIFNDIKKNNYEDDVTKGIIQLIDDSVITEYIENVKKQTMLTDNDKIDKNVSIVYSPLNGTGLKPVIRILHESGFTNIKIVKEQEKPDGNFPTCPYPNPEIKEAMDLGMKYAKRYNADLLLATDPDCDRCGIAVRNSKGEYQLLTGNETGLLLLDYICSRRIANGTMPEEPVFIKTIVTMDLAEKIATHYGVKTINVLTGFKFIGEQIGKLEKVGKESDYICGFEESYGYLTGSYVRDKDAVDAAFMICEMFAYYKTHGISLLDKLAKIYHDYGYCLNTLHSYEFDGLEGFNKMQEIMRMFRGKTAEIARKKVICSLDYGKGIEDLPKSDVLKFILEDNCSVVIRPSGTEPKLKAYISVTADSAEYAKAIENDISEALALRMY